MNLLFDLSTSHYSKVRICAQNILSKMCKWFAYSYKLIVPKVSSSKSKKVTRTWRCLFLKAPRICFSCRYGFKVLMAILLIIFIVPTKSNSGFIEVRVGWTISWYLLLYHQDQFRIKSGSGDQNKQIVPSAETLGWTLDSDGGFMLEQYFSCGTVHRTILAVMTSISEYKSAFGQTRSNFCKPE